MNIWVGDQGSHFKNEFMNILASDYSICHNFVVAYSTWANGTVENFNNHVIRAARALYSELKHWTDVASIIQSARNDAPLPRLGKGMDFTFRSPLQVKSGIKPRCTMLVGKIP